MTALTIDTTALKDRITQSVVSQFAAMIPEEAFAGMVDEVIQKFFNKTNAINVTEINGGWHDRQRKYRMDVELTPFQVMVWKNVQELVAEKLDEYFAEHKNALKDEMGKMFATPRMDGAVAGNVALLTHAMANVQQLRIAEQAMQMMQDSLQNAGSRMGIPELQMMYHAPQSDVVNTDTATVQR